ncbi:MAG: histidine phosphatase family protein [Bacilli bacterium]
MKIYVIRHGKTVANLLKVHNAPETNLADIGIEQAKRLREKIKNINYDIIISSPFIRAKNTAEIINVKNKSIIFDDRLKERYFGTLIGKTLTDINREGYWDYYNEYKYEDCEDIKSFLNRVNNFIEELKQQKYENVLVVTHKGVGRAFKVYFNGVGNGKLFNIGIKNCEMLEFEL